MSIETCRSSLRISYRWRNSVYDMLEMARTASNISCQRHDIFPTNDNGHRVATHPCVTSMTKK